MIKGIQKIARMLGGLVARSNDEDSSWLQHERALTNLMAERAAMTGGRGFRQFPKPVRKFSDGTTRGDRKRAARERANSMVSEARPAQYRHQRSLYGA